VSNKEKLRNQGSCSANVHAQPALYLSHLREHMCLQNRVPDGSNFSEGTAKTNIFAE